MQGFDPGPLRQVPLFRNIDDATMNRILAGTVPTAYAKGETIFHYGDPADHLFFVLDGWVKVYRMSVDGEEALIRIFSAGETIADAVALSGRTYPASGQAVEKSQVLAVPAQRLLAELKKSPELAVSVISALSYHMHSLVLEIEHLKTRTGIQRACEFLLDRCTVDEGPAVISIPYDRVVLSSMLGMKPESLSRIFNRLRKVGVKSENGRVAIADVAALSQFCEGRALDSLAAE